MVIYQNLAYCRYVYIWSFLYLANIIYFSPSSTIICIITLHIFNNSNITKNKKYGIILLDFLLLISCLAKNFKFHLIENIICLLLYLIILLLIKVNPIILYTKYLEQDNENHKDELYIPYMFRIWNYFLFNKKTKNTLYF